MAKRNKKDVAQEYLFEDDKILGKYREVKDSIWILKTDIEGGLKKAKGYMGLIKNAPTACVDIFFKCQQDMIAKEHLELVSTQSRKLSDLFLELSKMVDSCILKEASLETMRYDHGIIDDERGVRIEK